MEKVIRSISKTIKYFEEKIAKYPLLKDKSKILAQVILAQTKETSTLISFLKNCKKKSLKQRHWTQIFTIIKAPHLKTSQKFTIINLREVHIQNYMEEINKIIEQADLEMKYENIIAKIEKQWDYMKLKIIPYAQTTESFILAEADANFETIEDHLTTLETVHQSKNASHVKDRIEEWIKNLIIMRENLSKWIEAQNNWIYLEPIFSSPEIQNSLSKEYQTFLELQASLKRILFSAYLNPKAIYNLVVNNRIQKFNNLINYFSTIKKHVDDYLESRRLKYPRFFFMSDSDFLEFLVKAGAKENIDKFIHKLFPGVASLQLVNMSNLEPAVRNPSDETFEKIDLENFNNVDTGIIEYEKRLKEDGIFLEIDENNELSQNHQILGMVSHYSDLFLFQRKVNYNHKAEVWLTGVEYSAQETVSKMIGYAVSSFPKQPLDEWIIDYPQQTILSTIHLILTHEINEMLHDLRKNDEK